MLLDLNAIYRSPILFAKITGMSLNGFYSLYDKLQTITNQCQQGDKCINYYSRSRLNLRDSLLAALIYYHTDTSQLFIGELFGVSRSSVARLLDKLDPLLERCILITHKHCLSEIELIESLYLLKQKDKCSLSTFTITKFWCLQNFLIKMINVAKYLSLILHRNKKWAYRDR